jgi:hypothetical protein
MKKNIRENEFSGAPGGSDGTTAYGPTYGTPAGPNQSQDPGHFQSSNKNKARNQSVQGIHSQSKQGVTGKELDQLYVNPRTAPTPDDIIAGMKYEMGQQIKKDKAEAKRSVITNLKKDPRFYRDLKQLNITDKDMVDNMTENRHPNDAPEKPKVTPNIEETKKIFAEMAQGYGKKYVVNSQICDVMREMWAAKNARSLWRNGG